MARVTVEDCIDKVESPYELVLVAKERATQLNSGIEPTLDKDNDKNTVIALREIADETLSSDQLKNDLIQEYQTNTFTEDEEINEIEDNRDETETNEFNSLEVQNNNDDADNSIENTVVDTAQDDSENSSDDEKKQDI